MNRRDPHLKDRLAAEYVLGTLHGRARARFERLLVSDYLLQRAVAAWGERLMPWTEALPPTPPRPGVWRAIEARTRPMPVRWWQRNAVWQGVAASAMAAGLAAALILPQLTAPPTLTLPPEQTAYLSVLNSGEQRAVWLIRIVGPDRLVVDAVGNPPQLPGKDYELWMLPADGSAPRSMGVLPIYGEHRLSVDPAVVAGLPASAGFAVSLEPTGGSPTGQPTGPVQYQGELIPTG